VTINHQQIPKIKQESIIIGNIKVKYMDMWINEEITAKKTSKLQENSSIFRIFLAGGSFQSE
jgi:hypothetical protein